MLYHYETGKHTNLEGKVLSLKEIYHTIFLVTEIAYLAQKFGDLKAQTCPDIYIINPQICLCVCPPLYLRNPLTYDREILHT